MSASEVAQGVRGRGGEIEARKSPLSIYPKHPAADDVYRINGAWAPAAITTREKRFTEAELAAEYWMLMGGLFDGHGKKARERRRTVERFAQLPHYDDEVS